MTSIHIRNDQDCIIITILGRVHPNSSDYWDANWLSCTLEVSLQAKSTLVNGQLRNEDLVRFISTLKNMLISKDAMGLLDVLDGWLDIQFNRKDIMILVDCHLENIYGNGDVNDYAFVIDDNAIKTIIDEASLAISLFPVLFMVPPDERHS